MKHLLQFEETGFKGSGNLPLALALIQPLTAAFLHLGSLGPGVWREGICVWFPVLWWVHLHGFPGSEQPWGIWGWVPFTDEETKAWRNAVTCPKSQSL